MNKQVIFIAIFLVVLAAAIMAWVVFSGKGTETPAPATQTSAESAEGGLGAEISEAQNPLKRELPNVPVGAINPLEGVYQNPFGD